MPQISAVIITFNEEKNIGRCLDSLAGVVDDVVIVDSYSTDKTEEIAKSKGARFVQHPFHGHIEQKNYAITQALHPYVLSLDADEALDETLKEEIKRVKNNWTADGYYMNRLTNYCGKWIKHGGWYPDRKLRLWDSRKGKWAGTNPHDRYEMINGTKTESLNGDILHYSYYSINEHIKQSDYFAEIAAKAMNKAGKKSTLLNLVINPSVKFLKTFVFQAGFMDGYYGYVIAKISASSTYDKYKKLREFNRNS